MRGMSLAMSVALLLAMGSARAGELTVSAAASLVDAFGEIKTAYEREHPGTTVHLNTAASGVLLQQIRSGAPVDVFASADEFTMDEAAKAQLIDPAQRHVFARNTLVVVVPPGAAVPPRSLQDLAGPGVKRIAVGNPQSVPAGRYAKSALDAARLWAPLSPKLINTQNVRQALDYVARGEVDAGFVYGSDASTFKQRVRTAFRVPLSAPINYPIAAVARSANPTQASKFITFVRSSAAQAILRRYGFSGVESP
jgi:molybdate transport system substrate-binding protein